MSTSDLLRRWGRSGNWPLAALAPAQATPLITLALILLGMGWSLGLVAGTTVLTTAVPTAVRATVQGQADVAVALAGAAGGLASRLGFAWIDFRGLGFALAALSLVVVAAVRPRRGARASDAAAEVS